MIGTVIQARMRSTRLPGKVLLPFGQTVLLQYIIDRVAHSKFIDKVIVATSTHQSDDAISDYCSSYGIICFRGPEFDVLSRYYHASSQYGLETIIRLTADDPFKDPYIIDRIVQTYLENKLDYCSNTLIPTFPEGLDVEVFSQKLLQQAHQNSHLDYCREHVTPWMYESSNCLLMNYCDSVDRSSWRMTIDYEEDYNCLYRLSKKVDPQVTYESLMGIIEEQGIEQIMRPSIKRNEGFNAAKSRST